MEHKIEPKSSKGEYLPALIKLHVQNREFLCVMRRLIKTEQCLEVVALSMDPQRKNSFFEVAASTFINNKVELLQSSAQTNTGSTGKGGVAYVSGISSGIHLSESCIIEGNSGENRRGFCVENQAD